MRPAPGRRWRMAIFNALMVRAAVIRSDMAQPTMPTVVQVQDDSQVEPPFLRWDVGDVRQPLLIRPVGAKVPFQQVRRHRMLLVALGRGLVAPDLLGPQATQPHQARDTILAARYALGFELMIDARTTIGLVAVIVHGLDLLDQFSIRHLPSADRSAAPGIDSHWATRSAPCTCGSPATRPGDLR